MNGAAWRRRGANFGDASGLAALLSAEGLEIEVRRLFFGSATAVCGRKPGAPGMAPFSP